jgi:phenylpropionate dioxygenase-like ring-hydroxylating dioxygenase large terminal subunit
MTDTIVHSPELLSMMEASIAHGKNHTLPKAPAIVKMPASVYYDPIRFEREVLQLFKRLPLMLATSAEMPKPGDYKTIEAVGMPILIVRAKDGTVRAFINSCLHRGANIATSEYGNSRLFMCPYHGWTYSPEGRLVGVASQDDFGDLDKTCLHLKELPSAERAGLIWVIADPLARLNIDDFLSGYDGLLSNFGFSGWHFFAKRTLRGPNWKVAYDGYLDFYHLPVLHRNTFGEGISNQAIYNAWGPHQRVQMPASDYEELEAQPRGEWPSQRLLDGVWTIFPHVSIASFNGGGRGVMISQLLPGATVDESWTTQIYLMERKPSDETAAQAHEQFAFLENVVQNEDYFTGLRLQRALKAGGVTEVMLGRNEGGAQRFHQWVENIIAADDSELTQMFSRRS